MKKQEIKTPVLLQMKRKWRKPYKPFSILHLISHNTSDVHASHGTNCPLDWSLRSHKLSPCEISWMWFKWFFQNLGFAKFSVTEIDNSYFKLSWNSSGNDIIMPNGDCSFFRKLPFDFRRRWSNRWTRGFIMNLYGTFFQDFLNRWP